MSEHCIPRQEAARIAIGYAVFSLLWVFVSDHMVLGIAGDDAELLSLLQTWKGSVYMLIVAVVLYFIIVRTLERQVSSESALSALNSDLERHVVERTAQLEAANRELEAFSYSVSHDLKAPLRGVDGYSQILLLDHSAQLDDEGRQLLSNIRGGVAQMHALIEDMLAYSRIERRSLEARMMDLGTIAKTIIERRLGDADVRHAAIDCDLSGVEAVVDREGFALAFRNLFENAIKFSRDVDAPRVTIGAKYRNDVVLLWVRDNGIGFDMQYHDRIFDIFQRLHRAEDFPGTGVGLALVKKAVNRMGGRVWGESEPGHGAVFFMELPR